MSRVGNIALSCMVALPGTVNRSKLADGTALVASIRKCADQLNSLSWAEELAAGAPVSHLPPGSEARPPRIPHGHPPRCSTCARCRADRALAEHRTPLPETPSGNARRAFWRATIRVRNRIASLNFVPEVFLRSFRQVTRCRASRSCPLRLGSPLAARADAVKVGRRADLDTGSAVDRPHLDGGEHDAMLGPAGWTWGPSPQSSMSAVSRRTRRGGWSSVTGCTLISAEHERMRQRATPDLQPALHRAHETVRIFAGMLRLQSVEQLPSGQ